MLSQAISGVNHIASEWLYGGYDERKLSQFRALYSIPGIRSYMDYLLDVRSDREYLDRYGMDYSDIHDPRKLSGTTSAAALNGYSIRMVSDNIKRLY